MRRKHIAFCVEPAYGHIVPTLGIAVELVNRGHKVSYAVSKEFAPIVDSIQAHPVVINPPKTREQIIRGIINENDPLNYKLEGVELSDFLNRLSAERTKHSLRELETQYDCDKPDLIIHEEALCDAGRTLAQKWNIANIRHISQFIEEDHNPPTLFPEDKLILITVPRFFQRHATAFDSDQRFKFVGFIPEGRNLAFSPWQSHSQRKSILISPTTGLLQQSEFCTLVIDTFRDQPWDVVLSISGSHDVHSAIKPEELRSIPSNVRINRSSANFDIMATSCLYIGQGGQGSTLEAIYCSIPQIVIPPTPFHYSVAHRVMELGLGVTLLPSTLSTDSLIRSVSTLLREADIFHNVKEASRLMRDQRGGEIAADTIESYLS